MKDVVDSAIPCTTKAVEVQCTASKECAKRQLYIQ